MQRLCGRPGCSDSASVVYGMHAEDLVFWIDALPEQPEDGAAVLCRRHADTMVVPRGWTLDDLRDPDLHLFRPPLSAPTTPARTPRSLRARVVTEQLQLGADIEASLMPDEVAIAQLHGERGAEAARSGDEIEPSPDADEEVDIGPWSPSFDEADDLDGLLSARSPLLSRAFRTADRPDG